MKWLYFPFFDHHIANSEYSAAELKPAAQGQLVPRGIWIRSMGVDLAHLSPQRRSAGLRRRLLQNFGASEESVLLLYAGRLAPEKNLSLLFALLAYLTKDRARDYRLLVVGDGIERSQWEHKCSSEMTGRALFLGHIKDRNVLADLYSNCDVFVHPNPREPFGIAPLEAMASGLPLVAPNTGGVSSYANIENAWTVDGDVTSFAEAIQEITTNRQLVIEKTRKALATAERYRWEVVASSFFDLYDSFGRMTEAAPGALPGAAFYSTSAVGLQAAILNGASQLGATAYRLAARFVREPRSRRRPRVRENPMASSNKVTATGPLHS